MLEVKNVTKLYNRRDGISNVCLDLEEGTVSALVGPNGAGKTTLIKVMAGLSRPDKGEVVEVLENTGGLEEVYRRIYLSL